MHTLIGKLKGSLFFRDSFWAVLGNGAGYGLLLVSGIIIARFLGKDIYGEYGLVKTTMFQLAAFSTLGLGYTSTKFVAEYRSKSPGEIVSIVSGSLKITVATSAVIAASLIIGANALASFLNDSRLVLPFRALGIIVILKAISTTQGGVLAGMGNFKAIAKGNVVSGGVMLVGCIPLTVYFGLAGSLLALTMSQLAFVAINWKSIHDGKKSLVPQVKKPFVKRLVTFSIPVAMQEFTYAATNWLGTLMIAKLASVGEVGLYTASSLWNSVIMFVPALLSNVMLSHLSFNIGDSRKQEKGVNLMLLVNLCCTVLPFIAVYFLTPWIVSFYGPTFGGMIAVMRVLIFSTIFQCCSNVLSSELIAQGATWALFSIRCIRDVLTLILGYYMIVSYNGKDAALHYSTAILACAITFFAALYAYYIFVIKAGMHKSQKVKD